jgi:hypothetical protein
MPLGQVRPFKLCKDPERTLLESRAFQPTIFTTINEHSLKAISLGHEKMSAKLCEILSFFSIV